MPPELTELFSSQKFHTSFQTLPTKTQLIIIIIIIIKFVIIIIIIIIINIDLLRGLVVRVPDYRSRGPGSISGATRFSEK
jgi:hypothetical protein